MLLRLSSLRCLASRAVFALYLSGLGAGRRGLRRFRLVKLLADFRLLIGILFV